MKDSNASPAHAPDFQGLDVMQDLTQIRIVVDFDDGVGNEETFAITLTPVHRQGDLVRFEPGEVAMSRTTHTLGLAAAYRIYKRLEKVRGFVIHRLLSPDVLEPGEG